jgi:hypothetical protein
LLSDFSSDYNNHLTEFQGVTLYSLAPGNRQPPTILSPINGTIHANNMFSRIEGVIIVKSGENPVRYLLDYKFLVGFTFFSKPKYSIWMLFHVIDVLPGALVLVAGESDGKAGFYFVCVHSA